MRHAAMLLLLIACEKARVAPPNATVVAVASASVAPVAAPPVSAEPLADPAPSASVQLGDAPDVRVAVPSTAVTSVRVGQTFGILVTSPDDFLDEWVLAPGCPLGEPLTYITRTSTERELLWKIPPGIVGKKTVKLLLTHRDTRTGAPKPTKTMLVLVDVGPP